MDQINMQGHVTLSWGDCAQSHTVIQGILSTQASSSARGTRRGRVTVIGPASPWGGSGPSPLVCPSWCRSRLAAGGFRAASRWGEEGMRWEATLSHPSRDLRHDLQ
eukprot:156417-Rhodomonas_salina.3